MIVLIVLEDVVPRGNFDVQRRVASRYQVLETFRFEEHSLVDVVPDVQEYPLEALRNQTGLLRRAEHRVRLACKGANSICVEVVRRTDRCSSGPMYKAANWSR